jgi:hypothetical protein
MYKAYGREQRKPIKGDHLQFMFSDSSEWLYQNNLDLKKKHSQFINEIVTISDVRVDPETGEELYLICEDESQELTFHIGFFVGHVSYSEYLEYAKKKEMTELLKLGRQKSYTMTKREQFALAIASAMIIRTGSAEGSIDIADQLIKQLNETR